MMNPTGLVIASLALAVAATAKVITYHPDSFVLTPLPTRSIPAQPPTYLGFDYDYINSDRNFGIALATFDANLGEEFADQFVLHKHGVLGTEFTPDDTTDLPWNATVPRPGDLFRLSGIPFISHAGFGLIHDAKHNATHLSAYGEIERTWYLCTEPAEANTTVQILAYKAGHKANCVATFLAVLDQPIFPPCVFEPCCCTCHPCD